jgi:hypothetical protein
MDEEAVAMVRGAIGWEIGAGIDEEIVMEARSLPRCAELGGGNWVQHISGRRWPVYNPNLSIAFHRFEIADCRWRLIILDGLIQPIALSFVKLLHFIHPLSMHAPLFSLGAFD